LLASSEQDIYLYNLSEGRFNLLELKFENSARPPMILSLSQSSNGDIWVGTKDQGLFIWPVENHKADSHNLRRVNQDGEMPPSTIYAIEFDREGNAWCSTQQGIIKLDKYGRFLARFTSADGLQGDDFNFSASFIDNQGRMYFGGSNGYSRFTPEEVDIDSTPPRLSLNNIDISSDGEVFSYDATDLQALELGHEDQHVRFDFSVLDFLDPEKNQYRHKLEGLDRVWIDNGTRSSASYTDIPAGKYVLRIQGSNSAGVWNRDGLSLNIQVAPPPSRTWWAKCIYSVLLALLGWFVKRVYDSYSIERRATQLAMERHHAAELADDEMQEQLEIMDNFVKSAYQHNVETLTLVNDVIAAQSETVTDVTARRLAGTAIERVNALALLEDCLYHENEALLVDLHKYTDIITTRLLEDSPVREETITTINEVSASLLPIEPGAPLAIALYELLENSIQHAFKEEALANYIHISFTNEYLTEQSAFRYCLTVQDNGRGLPVDLDPQAQDSAGMAILHTMAERLAGSLNFNSKDGTSISLTFTYKEHL
jgi:two-component sensor histidine kinase